MTLRELPVASKSKRVFQVFPLKHLILYVVHADHHLRQFGA